MKKIAVFLLVVLYIFALTACDSNNFDEEKIWTEQDIISMYNKVAQEGWVYVDCVVIPDFASERVGAVLFQDQNRGTNSVLFLDSDGNFQQSGTYAELTSDPNFTYLGEGAVTFKLKTDDGTVYDYTLTLSIIEDSVYFKAEDNLNK